MLSISFAINQYPLIQLNPKNQKRFPTYSAKNFLKAKATLFNAFGPYIIPLSVIPFHTLLSSTIYVYNTPTTYRFNNSFSVNIQIHIFHSLESSHGIQILNFLSVRLFYVERTHGITQGMNTVNFKVNSLRCSSLIVMIS